MYYLNDKHPKYEYALYVRVGKACPYIKRVFVSIDDVYRYIHEIEKRHNHYSQSFYIDNDFYKNEYANVNVDTYYKFLRRNVEDWQEFTVSAPSYNNVISMFV